MALKKKLKNVVLCHTNDFPAHVNDKIKGWVEYNGGIYAKDLTDQVTHLLASKKAWKRCSNLVREARRKRSIHVVKLDWLEDSLSSSNKKSKPVDELKYAWEQRKIHKMLKKAKPHHDTSKASEHGLALPDRLQKVAKMRLAGKNFDQACREFEKDMGQCGFHPYKDSTDFIYLITLLRADVAKQSIENYELKVGARPKPPKRAHKFEIEPCAMTEFLYLPSSIPYFAKPVVIGNSNNTNVADPWAQCIQLFESDNTPHTYACYTQYSRSSTSKIVHELAPPGSTWQFAWDMFRKFFVKKCRVEWHERSKPGTEISVPGSEEAGIEDAFEYLPPKEGCPDGVRKPQQLAADSDDADDSQDAAVSSNVENWQMMEDARDGSDCV